MQVTTGRRWFVVLALVGAALLASTIASAQDPEDVHRFFGFQGDITIDGQSIGVGAEIVAMVGSEEIGRTAVNPANSWIIDVDAAHIESPCPVSFVVDGVRVDPDWEYCPSRVRLELGSSTEEAAVSEVESEQATDDASEAEEDTLAADDEEDVMEAGDENDSLKDADENGEMEAVDEDGGSTSEQAVTTPAAAPQTGSGGLLGENQ